jgi:myo-inositol-1(or 4)-monophosphatase
LLAPDAHSADKRDLNLLLDTVREAGALALTMFRQKVRNWIKPDGSPVTEADVAVDKLLRARLRAARPAYGWLSEETPDDPARLKSRDLWIADPIDGTRTFLEGGAEWCVAAALIREGRPVLAAVYAPVKEEFFEASLGEGARLGGSLFRIIERSSLDGASVAGSSSALKKLSGSAPIRSLAKPRTPLVLRLCYVASGVYDAAVSTGMKSDWDLAAGDLIVHEAGGIVTGSDGLPFTFNNSLPAQRGMVAAGRNLHQKIISVVGTDHGKNRG